MASPASIREFRFKVTSTHRTTHQNAAASSGWNIHDADVQKLKIVGYDDSGLVQEGIPSEEIRTRMHDQPAPTPGLRKGNLKVTAYFAGAFSNTDIDPESNILACALGGIAIPTTNRSSVAVSGVSTVNTEITGVGSIVVAGQAALEGVKGDARGGGEVKPINGVSTDHYQKSIASAGSLSAGDAVVYSTTIYPDEDAAQTYMDTYAIGHATADHFQTIGGVPAVAFSGLGVGEIPKMDLDIPVSDHKRVASGDRGSMNHASPTVGGLPAFDKGIGLCHIGDYNSSTRTSYKCGDFAFTPGVSHEEQPQPGGINGVGGRQHMPGVPTFEITVLMDEDDGLIADFENQTAKTILLQFGHTATRCVAFEIPKAYLDARPAPATLGNLRGYRLKFHGTEDFTASNDLRSAAFRIHKF